MITPLSQNELRPPEWISLIPLIDLYWIIMHKRASAQLLQRSINEVEIAWKTWTHLSEARRHTGNTIRVFCRWPNSLFVPSDECAVILPADSEMSGVGALLEITKASTFTQGEFDQIQKGTFLDLLLLLYSHIPITK
jgi:hypothetical protein